MIGYERTYATGRTVASIMELFGWGLVAVGALAALAGFTTGGLLGAAQQSFGRGNPDLIVRILGMLPGLAIVWAGLVSIMLTQQARASMDSAEMAREMLKLSRDIKQDQPAQSPQVQDRAEAVQPIQKGKDTTTILYGRTGKGYTAIVKGDGTIVLSTINGPKTFTTMTAAQDYIA
jgi:hypothetical protein